MSVSGGLERASAIPTRAQWMRANVTRYLALLGRKPRSAARLPWLAPLRVVGGATAAIAALGVIMALIDARAIGWCRACRNG